MGTWLVGTIVFALIALAARKIYKDHKNTGSCGCNCGGCSACPSSEKR